MKSRTGYWLDKLCRRDDAGNREDRRRWWSEGLSSDVKARQLRQACREDVLFFVNAFGWLLDPLDTQQQRKRFVTWKNQDRAFVTMEECYGKRDILWRKSRKCGATWCLDYHYLHRFLFFENQHFGLVSRVKEVVDNKNDPDALLQKLDFALYHLPAFLKWKNWTAERVLYKLFNPEMESSIVGTATTKNMFAGGRKISVGLDEVGLFKLGDDYQAYEITQHVSNNRHFISALYEPVGLYYDLYTDPPDGMATIELWWHDVPPFAAGMYVSEGGELKIIDKSYEFPPDYKFELEEYRGLKRSPWVDNEFARAGAAKRGVLQQIYGIAELSGSQYFEHRVLQHVATAHTRPPQRKGQLIYDGEKPRGEFVETEGGELSLWCPLGLDGTPPPQTTYSIGGDISAGSGGTESSNSTLEVIDDATGEQVGEYVTMREDPTRFAKTAVALAWFFLGRGQPAYLNWESNGPLGQQFTKEIQRLGFGYVYYRNTSDLLHKRKTLHPGWHNKGDNLAELFGEMQRAMARDELIIRSAPLVKEARQYVWLSGKLTHVGSRRDDHATMGRNHGDRVVGLALAWLARQDHPPILEDLAVPKKEELPPYYCLARTMAELNDLQTVESDSRW